MEITNEARDGAVVERHFTLAVGDESVPGIHWLPADADAPHPTVCVGHGGFQHKRIDNVLALANQLVTNLGIGVVALDAPEHGDRVTDPEETERVYAAIRSGDRDAMRSRYGKDARRAMAERAKQHVGEWQALLDDLQTDERWAAGPFGWWGVSMGTIHGLPLTSRDERIAAAVFGLNALTGDERWEARARTVTVPVLFLCQSEDELMTRDAALGLWDALGSAEKTLHLNPGRHVEVPKFERQASEDFYRRHLLGGPPVRVATDRPAG